MDFEKYQILFRALPISCIVMDPEFVVKDVTQVYLDITHRAAEEMVDKNYFDVFSNNPLDPERAAETSRILCESFEKVKKTKETQFLPVARFDLPGPDGFVTHYWTTWTEPLLDDDGEVMFLLHRVEDVTRFMSIVDQLHLVGDSVHALGNVFESLLRRVPNVVDN